MNPMYPTNVSEICNAEILRTSTPALDFMIVVGLVITGSVAVVGGVGNLLTVLVVWHQSSLPKSKRCIEKITSNTVLILNLVIADFFYCIISLPVMFVIYWNLHHGETMGLPNGICKWAAFIRYTNAIAEWTTLGLMAFGRCVTVYRYRRRLSPGKAFTRQRTIIYCVVLWICASLCQIPTLTETYGAFGYNKDTVKCDFMSVSSLDYTITPRVFFFALESAVPCCLILVGYIVILLQVYSSDKFWRRSDSLTPHTQMLMALRTSRTTTLVVQLLTVYLVCVIPICIYNVYIKEICLGTELNKIMGIGIYCIYFLQYAINNLLYVLRCIKFRRAYGQFFLFCTFQDIPYPPRTTTLRECYPERQSIQGRLPGSSHPNEFKKRIIDIKSMGLSCLVENKLENLLCATPLPSRRFGKQKNSESRKFSESVKLNFRKCSLKAKTMHKRNLSV